MPRGQLRQVSPADVVALFWQAERGEKPDPQQLQQAIAAISDTDAVRYPVAVALLLLHGTDNTPPMVYIQRLRQIQTPCAKAYLGRLAWHTGQTDRAWTYWAEAVDCPETPLFMAQAYLQRGLADSACLALRKIPSLPTVIQRYHDHLLLEARCP